MLSHNLLLAGDDGYNLTNSLRFRSSASAYLNRTFGSGSTTAWTWSGWVKRGYLGANQTTLFFGDSTSSNYGGVYFSGDNLYLDNRPAAGLNARLATTQVFRDPSAWYHIVAVWNTTSATSTDRLQLYVNGVRITAFNTATYPAQNTTSVVNTNIAHEIGCTNAASSGVNNFYDGYLDEINFIDGQALTPTSFGSFNALTGVWQPARYTGTYGTNGFYLPFTDNSSLSNLTADKSGNSNNWTANNISLTAGATYDSMVDVPTVSALASNYAVWNPLVLFPNTTYQATMSNANMLMTRSGGGQGGAVTTIGVTSGKFYAEMPVTAVGGSVTKLGVVSSNNPPSMNSGSEFDLGGTSVPASIAYRSNGARLTNGTTTNSWGSTYTTGDVIGVAFDADTGKIWFAKNGTWQASGDPAAGTNPATTIATGAPFYFSAGGESGISIALNCGQRPFSYTPPTGFVALNTFNLPNSTIVAGNKHFDATTYTGNGTAGRVITVSNINNVGFAWVKLRSGSDDHRLANTVTGGNKHLKSNATDVESTGTNVIQAFSGNTFTVGSDVSVNGNGSTYVGWTWADGGTAVTNTAGTISAQVSANTTSGFSVVTWVHSSTTSTIGHGLGVAPSFIILKSRTTAYNWDVGCNSIGWGNRLNLNTTDAAYSPAFWNSTAPTSSVFTYAGSGASNGDNMVAYCFAPVAGYSAFGSYTGNGSTDGPFVYLGFRPKFLMVKRTDSAAHWIIDDSTRNTSNIVNLELYPSLSNAESSDPSYDFLSNGFKLRVTSSNKNASGGTYIYMAFAENPFKNSLAR